MHTGNVALIVHGHGVGVVPTADGALGHHYLVMVDLVGLHG